MKFWHRHTWSKWWPAKYGFDAILYRVCKTCGWLEHHSGTLISIENAKELYEREVREKPDEKEKLSK